MNQLTKKQILVRQTLKNVSGFNQAAEDFTRLEISGTDLSEQYSQMSSTLKNIHPENIVTEVDRIYQNTPSSAVDPPTPTPPPTPQDLPLASPSSAPRVPAQTNASDSRSAPNFE